MKIPNFLVAPIILLMQNYGEEHLCLVFRKKRGLLFGIPAIFVTFLDNIIMALGIFCGSVTVLDRG